MQKKPFMYILVCCLIAAFFQPWYIVVACVVCVVPVLEKIFTKESKELAQVKQRLVAIERAIKKARIDL